MDALAWAILGFTGLLIAVWLLLVTVGLLSGRKDEDDADR